MAAFIKPQDKLRYEQQLREGWDVVLPPLPIEEFDENKFFAGILTADNWGNNFLGITQNITKLTQLAKRKVHVFVLDTAGEFDNKYITGLDNSLSKTLTGEEPLDKQGHGTHCAGIITGDHPDVKLGIARDLVKKGLLKITPVKVLSNEGGGSYLWILAGIEHVINVKTDGIKVISLSLGGSVNHAGITSALKTAVDKGIFVFAAAGNSGYVEGKNTINFPGRDINTICVASLDQNSQRSSFSSVGKELDYSAPGRSIWSTYLDNSLVALSGTSMATPAMAAVSCWILSIFENINTQHQLNQFLQKYINDLGVPGHDIFYGHGTISIGNYISQIEEPIDPEPPVDPPIEPPIDNTKLFKIIIGVIAFGILLGMLLFKFIL